MIVISYLKYTLPIFNENCNVIFKSLTKFHFNYLTNRKFKLNILNNVFNNIACMRNLKDFLLFCYNDVSDDFREKFIKKLLLLNLTNIYFRIDNNKDKKDEMFSENELKIINPNIDFSKYKEIYIYKKQI